MLERRPFYEIMVWFNISIRFETLQKSKEERNGVFVHWPALTVMASVNCSLQEEVPTTKDKLAFFNNLSTTLWIERKKANKYVIANKKKEVFEPQTKMGSTKEFSRTFLKNWDIMLLIMLKHSYWRQLKCKLYSIGSICLVLQHSR